MQTVERKKTTTEAVRPGSAKLEAIEALGGDLFRSLKLRGFAIPKGDVRYLVDLYYQVQEFRKASGNQIRASDKDADEPIDMVSWFYELLEFVEHQVSRALDKWTDKNAPSVWAKSVTGIGHVIAAGLAAHIDIQKCKNVSSLWRFAGLDPTLVWEKGEKRPWNARLKQICFLIGDSFVKLSGNPASFYGAEYRKHKALYQLRNERLEYAGQVAEKVESGRLNRGMSSWSQIKQGKLPPFVIEWRARRKAVKLFLSHYWEMSYRDAFGKNPPEPYAVAILGHTGLVTPEEVARFESRPIDVKD